MSTKGVIGVTGLRGSGNELTHPPGSLVVATECVIPSKGCVQPRPGQMLSTEWAAGDSWNGYIDADTTNANSNIARALYQWGDALLISYTGSGGYKLAAISDFAGSSSRALVGSYTPPAPSTLRMKFAELTRSLYWTTDVGVYAVSSATGTARAAGLARSVGFYTSDYANSRTSNLTGDPSATGSWLAKDTAVAYRVVFGRKDENNIIHLSGPSGRYVVRNPADVVSATGGVVRSSNVVTVTVASHGFRVSDLVTLSSSDGGAFDQTPTAITATTSTTFTYSETAANHTSGVDITFSSGTKSVALTATVPATAVAGDFMQIYRTDESAGAAIDPGDECFLAYERVLTAQDISFTYASVTDTTPSTSLGAPLVTNQNTGQGTVAGFNERPPICQDLCVWDGRVWGGQTTDRHRLALRLIGVGSPSGIQSNDFVAVNTRVLTAGSHFQVEDDYSPTVNIDLTVASMAQNMFVDLNGITPYVEHDGDTGLGEVLLEQTTLGSTFAEGASGTIGTIYAGTSRQSAFADALALVSPVVEASSSRTGSTVTITTSGNHGLTTGQTVMIAYGYGSSIDANFPVGLKTPITVTGATTFTYAEAGSAVTMAVGSYFVYAATYKSDNNRQQVRFSKPLEPESWPLSNKLGGLPDGADVLRVTPLGSGNGLVVSLKNAGFFLVSGSYPYNVSRLDDTADLVAADSLVSHAGKLTGLTTQGICTITEAGVGIVSSEVDDSIRRDLYLLVSGAHSLPEVFAVSNEPGRQYLLFLPTASSTSDKAYVYHSLSGEFSQWSQSRTHGIVWRGAGAVTFGGQQLVLGDGAANVLDVSRNGFGSGQYLASWDAALSLTVNGNQSSVSTINVNTGLWSHSVLAGDAAFIGGVRYRITAKTTSSITINGTVSVSNAATITVYLQVTPVVTFVADAGGAPGVDKRIRELQLHFGYRHVEQLTVTLTSEKTSTTASVTVSPSDYVYATEQQRVTTLRVAVPTALQVTSMLRVSVSSAEAGGMWRLLGYSLTSEAVSERTGK